MIAILYIIDLIINFIYQLLPIIYIVTFFLLMHKCLYAEYKEKIIKNIVILITIYSLPVIYYTSIWMYFKNYKTYTHEALVSDMILNVRDIAFVIENGDPYKNKLYIDSILFSNLNLNYEMCELISNLSKSEKHYIKTGNDKDFKYLQDDKIKSRFHVVIETSNMDTFGISKVTTKIIDSTKNQTLFHTTEYALKNLITTYAARFLSRENKKHIKESISYKIIDGAACKYYIDPHYRTRTMLPKIISSIFPDMHKFDYNLDGFAINKPTSNKWSVTTLRDNYALLLHSIQNCTARIIINHIKFNNTCESIEDWDKIISQNIQTNNSVDQKIQVNRNLEQKNGTYVYQYNLKFKELHGFTKYKYKEIIGFAVPHYKSPQTLINIETSLTYSENTNIDDLIKETQTIVKSFEIAQHFIPDKVLLTPRLALELTENAEPSQ